jgi:hypothetical protein
MPEPHDRYREEDPVVEVEATAVRQEPQPAPPSHALARAADGGVIPSPTNTAGQFLDILEDGDFSADVHAQLVELAEQMRAVANTTNGKAKGSATISLKLELEGDAFRIQGDVKVKAPDLPRRRSILWHDAGSFTRFPPNQTQMFGSAPVRRI